MLLTRIPPFRIILLAAPLLSNSPELATTSTIGLSMTSLRDNVADGIVSETNLSASASSTVSVPGLKLAVALVASCSPSDQCTNRVTSAAKIC